MIPVFDLRTLPSETRLFPVIVDQYSLISIQKAEGTVSVDFDKTAVKSNKWIFLTPGQLYGHELSFAQGVMITFNESFLFKTPLEKEYLQKHTCFHETVDPTHIELEPIDHTNLDIVLKLLSQEWNKEYKSETILKSYLCILLELSQQLGAKYSEKAFGKERKDSRTERLIQQIEQSFSIHHDTPFYAKSVELTPKRANQICREATGYTITELIHKRLNLEMKKRIGYSKDSFGKIAAELSFKNNTYFSTFFKKHNNCTPNEFRLKCQNI